MDQAFNRLILINYYIKVRFSGIKQTGIMFIMTLMVIMLQFISLFCTTNPQSYNATCKFYYHDTIFNGYLKSWSLPFIVIY